MKYTGHIALILVVGILFFLLVDKSVNKNYKVGIIQMEELVYDYQGMKDATEQYNQKMDAWSNQTDSLETQLKNLYNEIRLDSVNGDRTKLIQDQQRFYLLKQSYYEFKQNIDQKAQEKDEKMTVGVINQLKEHIKSYAQKEGYNIIISNTQLQNVGYADEAIDVTEALLQYANIQYQGE